MRNAQIEEIFIEIEMINIFFLPHRIQRKLGQEMTKKYYLNL
jgi:hypothetical protein